MDDSETLATDAGLRIMELRRQYREQFGEVTVELEALTKFAHERVFPLVKGLVEKAAECQKLEDDLLGGRRRFRRPTFFSPPIPPRGSKFVLVEQDGEEG
jgi:hypothetical protein